MARHITSSTGLDLIKAFEGFRANAAPLPDGRWVIGHGHTASARAGAHISLEDAADLLKWDVQRLETPLLDLIHAPLTANQFDALISFAFNIGLENFEHSTVLRRLNEGSPVDAAAGFDLWRRALLAGRVIVVDALVRRRTAEKALFLATPGMQVTAPTPQLPPLCDMEMAKEHEAETPLAVFVDMEGNGEPIISDTPATFSPTEKPAEQSGDQTVGFVSLDDALDINVKTATPDGDAPIEITQADAEPASETEQNPVSEMAERIAGRLEVIGSESINDEIQPVSLETEPVSDPESDLESGPESSEDINAINPDAFGIIAQNADNSSKTHEGDEIAAVGVDSYSLPPSEFSENFPFDNAADEDEADQDAPPLVDEDGLLLENYEPDAVDYNEAGSPPHYDETLDLDPQSMLPDGQVLAEPQSFQPAYDRGRWIFILMGVIGIALTLGGLWQIQSGISMITRLDYIKGPGQAALGLLLVLTSGYYLLRRLSR